MVIDDGGAVFPEDFNLERRGMRLRDYFAAAALQGLLSNANFNWSLAPDRTPDENVARRCYAVADAMLAARKEPAA